MSSLRSRSILLFVLGWVATWTWTCTIPYCMYPMHMLIHHTYMLTCVYDVPLARTHGTVYIIHYYTLHVTRITPSSRSYPSISSGFCVKTRVFDVWFDRMYKFVYIYTFTHLNLFVFIHIRV